MIVVKVELIPMGIGEPQEIGRLVITNDGSQGNGDIGDYVVKLGRRGQMNSNDIYRKPQREGDVKGHRRKALPIWSLVVKALASVGFKAGKDVVESTHAESTDEHSDGCRVHCFRCGCSDEPCERCNTR